MKFKIIVLAVTLSMNIASFAGNIFSSVHPVQKPIQRFKIPNAQTLIDRLKRARITDEDLDRLRVVERLADKELSRSEIEKEVNAAFDSFWRGVENKIPAEVRSRVLDDFKNESRVAKAKILGAVLESSAELD